MDTRRDLELDPRDAEQVVGGKKRKKPPAKHPIPAAVPMIVVTGTHTAGRHGKRRPGPDPNEAEDC